MAQVPLYEGRVTQASGPLVTQRSSVVPGAFGAETAQGIGDLGQKTQQYGDVLAQNAIKLQEGDNKRAVDDGFTNLLTQQDAYIEKYKADHAGTAAYDNYGDAVKDLTKIREDIATGMPNSKAQEDFGTASRRQLEYGLSDLTRYASTERKRGLVQSSDGLIDAAKNNYANADTDAQRADALAIIDVNREHQGQILGEPKELVDSKKFSDRSQAQKQYIERVMAQDPAAAAQIYANSKGQFTAPDAVVLEHGIKSALIPQQSRAISSSVIQPTSMDPEKDLPRWLDEGAAQAEKLHPGDEVFASAVATQIYTQANRVKAAQLGVQRDGIDYIQGQLNSAEEAGHGLTLNEITSTPEGQAAWAAIRPTTQKAFLNQIRIASQGPRTPTPQGDLRFLSLRGMSLTDPAAFAQMDLTHETNLMRGQRMQLAERQQNIIARKPLNEDVSKALSVMNANQMIQPIWPKAEDKNSDDYRQFVGALEDKLTTFNAVHGRKPNDQDIKKMGQELLLAKRSGGFLGMFQSTTRTYEAPTAEFVNGLNAATKKAGLPPLTQAEINEAYKAR